MKKVITLCFMFFCVSIIFSACDRKTFEKIRYEGMVYDSAGGSVLAGAVVTIEACRNHDAKDQCSTFVVGSATTDNTGHLKFSAKAAKSERYFLHIQWQNLSSGFPVEDIKNLPAILTMN